MVLPDALDIRCVKRVLVVMLRHHGDVLLTSPVFSVLSRALPDAEIDALVYHETAPMLLNHPAVSIVHTIERSKNRGLLARWQAERKLLKTLRERRFDLLIILGRHWRGWRLSWQLRPRYTVGPWHSNRFWRMALTHCYWDNTPGRHRAEINLDALRRLGIQPLASEKHLVYVPGTSAEAAADAICSQYRLIPGQFIHFHPGSRWHFKCLTVEQCAELLNQLRKRKIQVVITGAPDDRETRYIERVLSLCQYSVVNLAGRLSLQELGALIARAGVFVGVDSAPMHIAAAVGTPVVAVFGPTKELEWAPWQTSSIVVSSRQHLCRPCNRDGCGGGKISECLTGLSVEDILNAIILLMNSTKRV